MAPCLGVRMVGSTACAIAMVACGQADAYFGAGFHIWDIVAAEIILTEAGGIATSLKGGIEHYNLEHLMTHRFRNKTGLHEQTSNCSNESEINRPNCQKNRTD